MLARFESLAWDAVTEAGGRVVKLIGDEAMFVCPSAAEAARGAIDIVRACAAGDLPPARGGLALGPLLSRDGDYFGPAVNLASRLVDRADPGTVIADARFREELDDHAAFAAEQMPARTLKGIGSVPLWRLTTV